MDECRIIQTARPSIYGQLLKEFYTLYNGQNKLTSNHILTTLEKNPGINYYLYTGELDTLTQVSSLTDLIGQERVNYKHFPESGHAGWLFEPLVWTRLMQ